MQTKTDQIRAAWAAGDRIGALRIAARFFDRSADTITFQRGMDARNNPDFYRQIGKEPDQILQNALEALATRFGLHSPQPNSDHRLSPCRRVDMRVFAAGSDHWARVRAALSVTTSPTRAIAAPRTALGSQCQPYSTRQQQMARAHLYAELGSTAVKVQDHTADRLFPAPVPAPAFAPTS
jgi:hypothetical protein